MRYFIDNKRILPYPNPPLGKIETTKFHYDLLQTRKLSFDEVIAIAEPESYDENYDLSQHFPAKTLDELKAEKLAELNTNYQSALTFTHTFTDNTVLTLTLTDTVQTELNKRGVSLSVNTDENKTFVYYDNNYQKITRNASDSNEYLEAVADYLEDLREKRTDKTIAINAAQNETELNNVDISF